MALEVGAVVARLGAVLDDDGFNRWDRRVATARRDATRNVEQRLEGRLDGGAFDAFERAGTAARRRAADDVELDLRADVDTQAFNTFESAEYRARQSALDDVELDLRADVERLGFEEYDELVDRTRAEALTNPVETRAGLDVDRSSFAAYEAASHGATDASGSMGASFGILPGLTGRLAVGMGAAGIAVAGTGLAIAKLTGAYQESAKVGAQTEAVIRATGGAAKVTAEEVGELAGALSAKTGQDDEAIQSGLNLLLTFKGVRNEVGAGNDVFNQASETLVDMSTALGGDAAGSAVQLGKALNDPTKGITALTRVGVTFTDQQKEQIKTLQESGRTVDAQKIILRELNSEFGGSAEAQATNVDRVKVSLGNLAETVGGRLAPTVEDAAEVLNGLLTGEQTKDTPPVVAKIRNTFRQVRATVSDGVNGAKRIIGGIFDGVGEVIDENRETLEGIGDNVSRVGRGVGRALGGIRDAFRDTFGGNSGTGKDIKQIAGALISFARTVTGSFADIVEGALPGVLKTFRGFAQVLRGVIRVVSGILTLDFGKAWDGVKDIFSGALKTVAGILEGGSARIRGAVGSLARGVSRPLSAVWDPVRKAWTSGLDFVLGGVTTASGAIASLLDAAGKIPGVGGKFKDLADDVRRGQRTIDKYRESLRETNREHSRTSNIEKLQAEVNTLTRRTKSLDKSSEEYRDTQERLRAKTRALNRATADGEDAGKKGARGLKGLAGGAASAAKGVADAAGRIAKNVSGVAKGLGIKAPAFNLVGAGVGAAAGGDAGTERKAVGGWVGQRGQAGTDSVRRELPSGSSVVNRHQAPILEFALATAFGQTLDDRIGYATGGTVPVIVGNGERILDPRETGAADAAMRHTYGLGIDDLFAAVSRPHYLATGGIALDGAKPGLAPYARAASKFGLVVSSGRRVAGGRTASGGISQHGTGDALDLAGGAANMLAFARAFSAKYGPSVDQLIHTPLGYGWNRGRKVPSFGAEVDAGHFDHVHIGDSTPGGAAGIEGGSGETQIATPRINGPAGGLLDVARGASKKMATDANAWAAKQAPELGSFTGGATAQGADANVVAAFKRAASTTSAPPKAKLSLFEAGIVESGLRNLNRGDRDSLGALQIRAGIHGRDLALDPYAGAVAFLTRGFTGRGGAIPLSRSNLTAGQVAQAVQGSQFPDRYDKVEGQARQYLAAGGRVLRRAGGGLVDAMLGRSVQAFDTGGAVVAGAAADVARGERAPARAGAAKKPKKKPGLRDRLDDRYGVGTEDFKALASKNTDRVEEYDQRISQVEYAGKDYALQERKNDQTEEVLVDEQTGAVNVEDVNRRVSELTKLIQIRRRVRARLLEAQKIAKRVIRSYTTVIGRLRKARAAARKSKSKKRKSAVDAYTKSIATYDTNRTEWRGKAKDLSYDVEDAKLDVSSLIQERGEVAGTKATPPDPEPQEPPDDSNTPPDDSLTITPPDDPPLETGTTVAEPSPADVAAAALAQVGSFQAARADLFGSFGANFRSVGDGASLGGAGALAQAAGTRYYGGASGGTDGGVVAGAGGTQIGEVNLNFTGPQPTDPHVAVQTFIHEIKAA